VTSLRVKSGYWGLPDKGVDVANTEKLTFLSVNNGLFGLSSRA